MKRLAWGLFGLVVFAMGGFAGLSCALNAPGYDGPKPVHAPFNGDTFENLVPTPDKNTLDVVLWRLRNPAPVWTPRDNWRYPAPPQRVGRGELRVTWVNHATALVQMDGVNLLTDPIFSERASPFSWVGPKRVRPPGLALEELPPIDVVVLGHNHYDHFDTPSLAALVARDRPMLIGGLGTKALLEDEDLPGGVDLDWWQSRQVADVQVVAVPAQHWSRRGVGDTRNTLWAGYVFVGAAGPVYFAGDTGFGPHFEQIYERFGPMRLALLPIGPFKPQWLMKDNHISPQEAVDAAIILRAHTSVAIHFGTFNLGDDGQDEDVLTLNDYLAHIPNPPTFWVLDMGEGRAVSQRATLEPEPQREAEAAAAPADATSQ